MTNEEQITAGRHAEPAWVAAPSAPAATPAPAMQPVTQWQECELFCIGDYAGVARRKCGWRGRFDETRWDPSRRVRPCPRCGEATLMELDFTRLPLRE